MRVVLALLLILGLGAPAFAEPLSSGDHIDISIWQDSKLDRRDLLIPPSGVISFPLAGEIKASGLTTQALADALRARLQKYYTSERLDITVSLSREDNERAPRIYITGEVQKPGPYIIKVKTSVLQAIALAGGLGPFAAKQRIQIRRKDRGTEALFLFDYSAFEAGRDFSGNIDLK